MKVIKNLLRHFEDQVNNGRQHAKNEENSHIFHFLSDLGKEVEN